MALTVPGMPVCLGGLSILPRPKNSWPGDHGMYALRMVAVQGT